MKRMDIIVAYDVNMESKEGQARLRKVATICKNFGQRVQYSLFECRVTPAQLEELIYSLRKVIDEKRDSLRIYILHGGREGSLRVYGQDRYVDFDGPLIL
ncbi:CRISPR-associated endoribonuclease Cas2 3 [Moorella thermoacetica]|jgi:CRISPR-associated protein Cas2|uniref:CRISPR-associated endoribonuclease Cas2 n=1 Tax=Neomoorella thermoacetica TaxID=1525 RepID=A0A1J5NQH1_NEOTH|nr:CRISPR-associated endonuclease Cas2 [Moorella sp. E306M]MDK2817234.1 CRISPR-associated protein Cas2 [Moorella sp. (in: firmicutes)]OIQ61457.1 CRISPR-associated endoribonuclease Cas2 3 [Moorella thermoacetica]GEA17592.1 CRISPR-associated endoribonuclease Cas2 1 [Moorella sp. E306M]